MKPNRTMQPFVSVVIPTYNRTESLLRTLHSLSRQTYPADRFEVIVVDDGSSDGTMVALQEVRYSYRLRCLRQPHLGVGAARSIGSDDASGELLLYLDDDMIVEADALAEHVSAHASYPGAVIKGQVVLVLDDPNSVFAAIHSGMPDLTLSKNMELQPISYQQVFAGHFSIHRRDMLGVGGWCSEPRGYGFQDLEFMYRCKKAGLTMLCAPRAVTYHHDHATTLQKVCQRVERASESAAPYLFAQHPELRSEVPMFRDKGPIDWGNDPPKLIVRKLIRQAASSQPSMWAMERAVPILERGAPRSKLLVLLYRWIVSGYIYRGYRQGLREAKT